MSSKKIIFSILDSPALGGAENYLLANLNFLKQKGFEIVLATYNQKITKQHQQDFKIINLPYRLDVIGDWKGLIKFFIFAPLALFWLTTVLLDLKRESSEVIIYTPGFTERLFFSPLIKLLGLRLVWLEYGPVAQTFKRHFGLPRLLYFLSSSFPDQVITISDHCKKSLLAHTRIPAHKIIKIHPGTPQITALQLKKYQAQGQAWKKEHQLLTKKLITFVGRLAAEKEVDVLIKAFAKLKNPSTQLVIIGAGPEKETYQQLARKLNVSQQIIFTGYADESKKLSILAVSDIFVFPSAWELEGFGMTTIEAMMMGVPIITSGAGPQAEIIIDGKEGLYFKPRQEKDLAQEISHLLSNQQLSKKLGQNARAKAIELFTLEKTQRLTTNILK